jgi:nicotinate-nucleotide adenylyltransferase
VDVGKAAEAALGLTQLLVMAAKAQPLRPPPVASAFHRFAMVSLTVAERAAWEASDVELGGTSPSYTSVTLRSFHEIGCRPTELYFIIGADAFADIGAWKDYPQLLDYANFVVVSRPGCPTSELPGRLPHLAGRMQQLPPGPNPPGSPTIVLIDAKTADVSSTAIRERRAQGRSIAGLVEAAVEQHIEKHGLYAPVNGGGHPRDARTDAPAGRMHGES